MREIHRRRTAVAVSIVCVVMVALPAAAAGALDRTFGGGRAVSTHVPAAADAASGPVYMVLGDSVAASFQSFEGGDTHSGYAEQVFQAEQGNIPDLRLVKLACPGERTSTIDKAEKRCPYAEGSQLAQAVATLEDREVAFVTLQIGANDLFSCFRFDQGVFDEACVDAKLPKVSARLTSIVETLRAAGPDVPIIGVTNHDPLLALWTAPGFPQELVEADAAMWDVINDAIAQTFAALGAPVADVEAAFSDGDFDTIVHVRGFGDLPLNVARICQWTIMCATQGGDPHPNTLGYVAYTRAILPAVDAAVGGS